jgi:hypothetical protein
LAENEQKHLKIQRTFLTKNFVKVLARPRKYLGFTSPGECSADVLVSIL